MVWTGETEEEADTTNQGRKAAQLGLAYLHSEARRENQSDK
jgi:hypothetical protein